MRQVGQACCQALYNPAMLIIPGRNRGGYAQVPDRICCRRCAAKFDVEFCLLYARILANDRHALVRYTPFLVIVGNRHVLSSEVLTTGFCTCRLTPPRCLTTPRTPPRCLTTSRTPSTVPRVGQRPAVMLAFV